MKVFSGSSNKPLAEAIVHQLRTHLSPSEIFVFPDEERRIQLQEEVVDEHTVVVQSTATPADQNYMELFFIIDALKRSGASAVTAVIPYMGYQRQDHVFRSGEAVSFEVIVKTLEALGVSRIIAYDLHTIKIPEFFHIPLTHLSALELFAQVIKKNGWDTNDSVLVTPDMGGIRRIQILSEMLNNMPYVTVVKDRDLATGHAVASGFEGEVRKRILIVDDMAASGKTLVNAANLMKENGAEEFYAFATHPVFAKGAAELLQQSVITKTYVTDTVFVPQDERFAKLEIISVAGRIAEELKTTKLA
jgi:ribose-phosphate pyrophosphokinase